MIRRFSTPGGCALACLLAGACGEPAQPAPPEAPALAPGAAREQEPGEPRFGTRRELRSFGKPAGVVAADFDGDGREDLAAVTLTPGTLQLWESSRGGLGRRPRLFPAGDHPLPPVVVRRAGHLPAIACASRAERTLTLLDPQASEEAAALGHWELESPPRALAAGDANGAGTDALLVATDTHLHLVELATGATYQAPLLTGAGLTGVRPTCAAIWPEQGFVAVAFQLSRELCVYSVPDLMAGAGAPQAVVQLEGIPRAVVPFVDRGTLGWLVAGGEDALWSAPLVPADHDDRVRWGTTAGAVPIWLGLMGPREAPDVVTLDKYGLSFSVLTRDAGSPATAGTLVLQSDYAGQTPQHGALGDFDHDGHIDLAVANRDAARVSILYGSAEPGRAFTVAPKLHVGRNPVALAIADLDADQREEVLVLNAADGSIATLARDVDGELKLTDTVEIGPSPSAIAAANLNGEPGDEVAALVQFADGAKLVLLEHGATDEATEPEPGSATGSGVATGRVAPGHWFARELSLPMGTSGSDLMLHDLNGDHFPDVVSCDPDGGRLWLRMHTGRVDQADAFESAIELSVEGRPAAVTALEREPRTLLAIVSEAGPTSGLLVLVDPGTREPVGKRIEIDALPVDVVATDLSGDGKQDLVVLAQRSARVKSGLVQVLLQEGAGWRREAPLAAGVEPKHLTAVDLDGDGRDDLLAAARGSHHVDVWLTRQRAGALVFLPLADLGAGLGPMDVAVSTWAGRTVLLVPNTFSGSVSSIRVSPRAR